MYLYNVYIKVYGETALQSLRSVLIKPSIYVSTARAYCATRCDNYPAFRLIAYGRHCDPRNRGATLTETI